MLSLWGRIVRIPAFLFAFYGPVISCNNLQKFKEISFIFGLILLIVATEREGLSSQK